MHPIYVSTGINMLQSNLFHTSLNTVTPSDFLKQCAQHGGLLTFKTSQHQIPNRWENKKGEILWLSYLPSKTDVLTKTPIVQVASRKEVLSNPEIYRGAIEFNKAIEQQQLSIDQRKTKYLSKKQNFNAPSISNREQTNDLLFGEQVYNFLLSQKNSNPSQHKTKPFKPNIKNLLLPFCLGLEGNHLKLINTRLFFTHSAIQKFKLRFNQMMNRRIKLLNHMLALHKKNTIAYIELGFESDCTPKRIQHKLNQIIAIEKQSFLEFTVSAIEQLGNQLAINRHHLDQNLKYLFDIIYLWKTIWPHQIDLIQGQVNMQLQTLRIHPAFKKNHTDIELIMTQIESYITQACHADH